MRNLKPDCDKCERESECSLNGNIRHFCKSHNYILNKPKKI